MMLFQTQLEDVAVPLEEGNPHAYHAVIMETHRIMQADVTVIVHGESDGLVRTLHDLCQAAIRHAIAQACEPSQASATTDASIPTSGHA